MVSIFLGELIEIKRLFDMPTEKKMGSKWISIISLLLVFSIYGSMSYFGKMNPYTTGLLSALFVSFTGLLGGCLSGLIGRKTFVGYLLLSWLLCNLIIITNWWHFQYFRAYYNYDVFKFGSDGLEAARSLVAFEYTTEALQLLLLSALFSWASVHWYRPGHYRSTGAYGLKVICLALAGLCFSSTAGVLETLKDRNAFLLSPNLFHPMHAFFYPLDVYREQHYLDEGRDFFKQKNSPQVSTVMSSSGQGHGADTGPLNVIVINLESFRASFIGHYGADEGLTPNFDAIAAKYLSASQFYASSNFTVKAETEIFCGTFDHNIRVSVAEYRELKNLRCLPSLLSEQGYQTHYFHGNRGRFYNRLAYMPELGFEHLYFHADNLEAGSDGRLYTGWGVSDEDMYQIMLDKLTGLGEQPFFASVLTLTNHYPFNGEVNIEVPYKTTKSGARFGDKALYDNYRNTVYYTDYALGKFWEVFRASPLFKNTIVLITADHGIWLFPEEQKGASYAEKNETFFRMPLAIYHPHLEQPRSIDQISSQVDILPTLLELLGIPFDSDYYLGKSLLHLVEEPWAIMKKSGEQFVRYSDRMCYLKSAGCSGAHQQCYSVLDPERQQETTEECALISGDLLNGGTVTEIVPSLDVSKSYDAVAFENKRIFKTPENVAAQVVKHITNLELKIQQRQNP